MVVAYILLALVIYLVIAHFVSYSVIKRRVVKSRKWDLNICSGRTDGGGVNADIKKYIDLPNFVIIKNAYKLPFKDKQFDYVLCSHTIEHVEDPEAFYRELKRVGNHVVLLTPPLLDLGAVLNITEHRSIFLSFKTLHTDFPKFIPMPLGKWYQKNFGQLITSV